MAKHTQKASKRLLKSRAFKAAIKEVYANKPKTLDRSKSKEDQRKQLFAIAVSKAKKRK